jgi:hypothetical protein
MSDFLPTGNITSMIHNIRGQRVMLDRDLAGLYGVETKVLKQAVRRNIKRFPVDFMFDLSKQEVINLRSQIVTSSWGGPRYLPMAFTEQGVAMLSSVLNSERAIQVNIQVIRAFIRLRQLILDSEDLRHELEVLRQETDGKFRIVFQTLEQLLTEESTSKKKIGFTAKDAHGKYSQST